MPDGSAQSNRIDWIDTAKCFGIFAIVLGHTFDDGILRHYLYSFHVPLFFFVMGFIYRTKNKRLIPYIKKQAVSLLIPYFVFAVISVVIFSVLGKAAADSLALHDINTGGMQNFLEIFTGSCRANRPLWFLPCMFVFSVLCFLLVGVVERQQHAFAKKMIVLGIIMGSVTLCYLNETTLHAAKLFWKIDVAVFMLAFFFAAYSIAPLFRACKMKTAFKYIVSVLLLTAGGFLGIRNGEIGYLSNTYGNVFIFYLSAFLTILGICFLSMAIPNNRFTAYIGRHTLAVLLMHKFPIVFFQTVFPWTRQPMANNHIAIGVLVAVIAITACLIMERLILQICPIMIGQTRRVHDWI